MLSDTVISKVQSLNTNFCHVSVQSACPKKTCLNEKYIYTGEWQKCTLYKKEMTRPQNMENRPENMENRPEIMENIPEICQALKKVKTFNELRNLVERIDLAPVECQEMVLNAEDLDVDAVSVPLVPPECTYLTPVAIYGDGNCLPRCASLFAFHTQTKHAEMRVRIIIELVKNEEHYLSADLDIGGTKNSASTFAMFSEFYKGQRLNARSIKMLYRREVLTLIKDGTYMGA